MILVRASKAAASSVLSPAAKKDSRKLVWDSVFCIFHESRGFVVSSDVLSVESNLRLPNSLALALALANIRRIFAHLVQ